MENLKTIRVSKGNYNRVLCMEYSWISIPAGTLLRQGETILIVTTDIFNENMDCDVLVREVVDYDVISFVCENDDEYTAIVRNNNYNTYYAMEGTIRATNEAHG